MDNTLLYEPVIFSESAAEFRLPKWSELPDLELYMDQVITLVNKYIGVLSADTDAPLTPSMINNYVKSGILPSPIKKKYSRIHIARLIIICVLKSVLPIQQIGSLINILLRSRSDEDMFDFFCNNYTTAFDKTKEIIRSALKENAKNSTDSESVLSIAVMQAAAVSGSSKLMAEKSLNELMNGDLSADDSKY